MRYITSISLALIVLMALAMGCASPIPSPTDTPLANLAFKLDVKIDPKNATEGSASSFNKGIELFEAENWSMAIDQFTLALQVNPQLKYAHYFRGTAYNYLEQYQRAVQDYDKEIELYPNDATSYVVRAAAYYNLGQYALSDADEAMACSLDSDWC